MEEEEEEGRERWIIVQVGVVCDPVVCGQWCVFNGAVVHRENASISSPVAGCVVI